MAGVGRVVLRSGVAGILVALAISVTPPRVAAAEDEGMILTRQTLSSVVADLDGDGEREVVAIVAEHEDGAVIRVAAWGVWSGDWLSLGEEPLQHWVGSEGMARAAVLGETSAGLLTLQDGGRTRVIVVSAVPYASDTDPGACCLSFSEVTMHAGALRVELAPDDLGSVDSITTMDLEGDGRDELLVQAYVGDERDPWQPIYEVLHQEDDGFAAEPIPGPDGEQMWFHAMGESDGVAGDDLLFMTGDNRALIRVSADRDGLAVERVPARGVMSPNSGGIAGVANGIIVVASDREILTARWPRGGGIEPLASQSVDTWPNVSVVGEGSAARMIDVTGVDPSLTAPLGMRVLDLDLNVELELEASPEMVDVWEFAQNRDYDPGQPGANLYPLMGPIRGGLADGSPAFLGPGSLVQLDSEGVPTVSHAAPFLGGEVLGVVGPASRWVAIGSGWFGGGGWAYLGQYGFEPRDVPEARLSVVPLDAILAPPGDADPGFTLEGATLVEEPDGPTLYAAEGGFDAVVSGDRGTLVFTTVNDVTNIAEVEDGPITVTLDPRGREVDRRHDASMMVVGPSGVAHMTSWDLTILPDAPEVIADTSFDLFEAHASVFGEVAPILTVTVDGRPAARSGDGRFRASVEASIWPREVEIVVRDPIGRQTVSHVEVVGIADVRALPWIPMMAALTVLAGVILFLRTPVVRPQERVVMDGDGHLEEIDGDLA